MRKGEREGANSIHVLTTEVDTRRHENPHGSPHVGKIPHGRAFRLQSRSRVKYSNRRVNANGYEKTMRKGGKQETREGECGVTKTLHFRLGEIGSARVNNLSLLPLFGRAKRENALQVFRWPDLEKPARPFRSPAPAVKRASTAKEFQLLGRDANLANLIRSSDRSQAQ